MIWKNPFLSKNSEYQFQVSDYLLLFNSTVLEMINEKNFVGVSYISSCPGAGKTSLFRAFSPKVIDVIISDVDNDKYKDLRKQLERLDIIKNNRVTMISASLSFARNYSIIDEMFQNGRKKHVFLALLNYRIVIAFIKSIAVLFHLEKSEYDRITFNDIPQELDGEFGDSKGGKAVYKWACKGERNLCSYLDSDKEGEFEISLVHTTLIVLKLFTPANVLIDGKCYFDKTLMIFDDFHKLTVGQRECIKETLFTLKAGVGIWLGQRLESLKDSQLVSKDGSLGRDYNPELVIDNYWPAKYRKFYGMLENIADRRVNETTLGDINKFSDCLTDISNVSKYKEKLLKFIDSTKSEIIKQTDLHSKYKDILKTLDRESDLMQRAIGYECILIKENRKNLDVQQSLFNDVPEDYMRFKQDIIKKCENAAKFYLFHKLKIPFYSGINNLYVLSSYNVEQFLLFAGAYYEGFRTTSLEGEGRLKKKLTLEEQEELLRATVKHMWDDMDLRYTGIENIKNFLNNIARFCCNSRDEERASYAGGSLTGFALTNKDLKTITKDAKYANLVEVLAACLASKYLEKRESEDSDETIFYLNRWLCVFYDLTLAYGGFKRLGLNKVIDMCNKEHYQENLF